MDSGDQTVADTEEDSDSGSDECASESDEIPFSPPSKRKQVISSDSDENPAVLKENRSKKLKKQKKHLLLKEMKKNNKLLASLIERVKVVEAKTGGLDSTPSRKRSRRDVPDEVRVSKGIPSRGAWVREELKRLCRTLMCMNM